MKLFYCIILLVSFPAAAQNVGIGTTTPTRAKLEVVGVSGVGKTSAIFGSDINGISIQTNWPSIGFNQYRDLAAGNGKYMSTGYAALLYFDPGNGTFGVDMLGSGSAGATTLNGVRALTMLNNGNVGIREYNPAATLHVARGNGIDGTVVFAGVQHWTHFNYASTEHTYIRGGRDESKVYINTIPNGNIIMGAADAWVKMGSGAGDPLATLTLTNSGAGILVLKNEYNHYWGQHLDFGTASNWNLALFYFNNLKGIFSYSSGAYGGTSDRKLKTDIQPLPSVLEKVRELNPVSYEMINHNPTHKRAIGFIAQELKTLFPQMVRIIDDHAKKGINYKDLHTVSSSAMNVIAIKAVQEQHAQIKSLEDEYAELMERLKKISAKTGIN